MHTWCPCGSIGGGTLTVSSQMLTHKNLGIFFKWEAGRCGEVQHNLIFKVGDLKNLSANFFKKKLSQHFSRGFGYFLVVF